MASPSNVAKLYDSVINDVIANSREIITDEGGDESVLVDLQKLWKRKLEETKAIISEAEMAQNKHVSQPNQPVQQVTSLGATAQHLQPITPVHFLYTQQGANDVQKTGHKVTLSVPAHLAQTGLQTYVTAAPVGGASAVQLQQPLFQANIIASTQANSLHGGQQLHYLSLTKEQLRTAQQVAAQPQPGVIGQQYDGAYDTSEEEEEDDFSDNADEHDNDDDHQNNQPGMNDDEPPLNEADDISGDEVGDQFDCDNVVVCQYDKITRSKNRWKFHLKDGIMHLKDKDYVFHKAQGESEW